MTTDTGKFLPIAKQVGGVWLIGSAVAGVGLPLTLGAIFFGGVLVFFVLLVAMVAGGVVLLSA
ncbi:hypothetical protein NLX83_28880 [Allokutzneria sp. A3M-2-11 16]|uniref:hypothetical protein n=1 Tax=Allokutzneria sp. A3M-2-11 16 TaxID=2962043 RepID=UPI0020B76CE3|nr:hypothetical protein [Allokutzneria sp. A3M-2-11 16]MCP3803300.1 hypothetical protein [Allokutzneria sp. A3M-2-11 16]